MLALKFGISLSRKIRGGAQLRGRTESENGVPYEVSMIIRVGGFVRMLRAGGADRRIKKSRNYVTTAGGAVGGVRTEVSRGLAEGCMGGGRRSLRRLEGE